MVIQEPVQAAIWQCLNNYCYQDATFLAERLTAEVRSEEALFLLATCYYRSGKPNKGYLLLKRHGCHTPQCRFLFAQCCFDTNRLAEAESAINGGFFKSSRSTSDIVTEFGERAAFVIRLLAEIAAKTERSVRSADLHRQSLKHNPFLWSSFQTLCHMGENVDPHTVFLVKSLPNFSQTCSTSFPDCQAPDLSPFPGTVPVSSSLPLETPADQPCIKVNGSGVDGLVCNLFSKTENQENPVIFSGSVHNVTPLHMQVSAGQLSNRSNLITPATDSSRLTAPLMSGCHPIPPDSTGPASQRAPSTGLARKKPQFGSHSIYSCDSSLNSPLTPSFGVLPLEATPSPGQNPPSTFITPPAVPLVEFSQQNTQQKAPPRKLVVRRPTKGPAPKNPVFAHLTRDLQTPNIQIPTSVLPTQTSAVRRSSRIFTNASNSVKENTKGPNPKKVQTSPKAPVKKAKPKTKTAAELNQLNREKSGLTDGDHLSTNHVSAVQAAAAAQVLNMQKQSADGLMKLLQELGTAYQALSRYDLTRSIELFESLPDHHFNTGWVLAQVGRAYFERTNYNMAERVFRKLHESEPHHMDGMDLYSTTLWHLYQEVQLSALAQQLVDTDKMSPQAWCVSGNCFSLQKEHDTAIKFFQRAIQLNPNYAYAYTLLGHEYALIEEYDKALSCFRNALRVDSRHYNAWYGVGMIYYRQEKFSLAEGHFRKALQINPQSCVLLCHIGVVQHALKRSDQALQTLNRALALDPKNPLCKFHRASILFANDRHTEALKELEELKQIVPKESLIHFQIGKINKKLGNTHLALMNFSWATDLDPKGANNQIKEAIDKRYVNEDDDLSPVNVIEASPLDYEDESGPMDQLDSVQSPPTYLQGSQTVGSRHNVPVSVADRSPQPMLSNHALHTEFTPSPVSEPPRSVNADRPSTSQSVGLSLASSSGANRSVDPPLDLRASPLSLSAIEAEDIPVGTLESDESL